MVFNGHKESYVESIDEDLFAEIQVMYADGMLGNKAVFDAIAPLTTAVFNYMRQKGQAAYKTEQIFPWINDYLIDPDLIEEPSANNSLLAFLTQSPNFDMTRFNKNGD